MNIIQMLLESNYFIDNEFLKQYASIIELVKLDDINRRRQKKNREAYFEIHHILPRCFGGENRLYNLVTLTVEEHFECHKLLTKCTESSNKAKMVYAIKILLFGKNQYMNHHRDDLINQITPQEYQEIKNIAAKNSIFNTPEMRKWSSERMSSPNNPMKLLENREKTRLASLGNTRGSNISDIERKKKSEYMSGPDSPNKRPEVRLQRSLQMKGKIQSTAKMKSYTVIFTDGSTEDHFGTVSIARRFGVTEKLGYSAAQRGHFSERGYIRDDLRGIKIITNTVKP